VFVLGLAGAGLLAGALAAVAGFGIGTILTPVLALAVGAKLAVAAVSIPHAAGTVQRLWLLRAHVERRVLLWFGLTSAAGGLAGALLNAGGTNRALAIVFGLSVALAGVSELTGWIQRVRWGRRTAWVAGLVSGFLGGLVGNQGGIRSAALLGFDVPKESFVATATAIALCVDAARVPIYLATEGAEIAALWPLLLVAVAGVVSGTAVGTRVLGRIDQRTFHRVIGVALLALGVAMVVGAN
jgi:uncharacterized membrane protein YfcA